MIGFDLHIFFKLGLVQPPTTSPLPFPNIFQGAWGVAVRSPRTSLRLQAQGEGLEAGIAGRPSQACFVRVFPPMKKKLMISYLNVLKVMVLKGLAIFLAHEFEYHILVVL